MKAFNSSALAGALQSLRISGSLPLKQAANPARPSLAAWRACRLQSARAFSTTAPKMGSWLEPQIDRRKKMAKGRPRVPTGGSTKGTTVIWGEWGLRMTDHHRRISAKQLKMAEDTIRTRLRGEKYRLYKRKCCSVGVYVSGNEVGTHLRNGWRPGHPPLTYEFRGLDAHG